MTNFDEYRDVFVVAEDVYKRQVINMAICTVKVTTPNADVALMVATNLNNSFVKAVG